MTRLIDADALEKAINEWMPKDQEAWMDSDIPPIENLVVSIMMTIQELPTIDAVPVRRGKWIRQTDTRFGEMLNDILICSECRIAFSTAKMFRRSYCPNCGADMRGN